MTNETDLGPVEQLNSDIQNLVNDYSKPEWTVRFTTTVHADDEEQAIRLAKIDFAFENAVMDVEKF